MQAMAFYIIRSFQLSESLSKNRLEYWKRILEGIWKGILGIHWKGILEIHVLKMFGSKSSTQFSSRFTCTVCMLNLTIV